jgi:hypothetical protein
MNTIIILIIGMTMTSITYDNKGTFKFQMSVSNNNSILYYLCAE